MPLETIGTPILWGGFIAFRAGHAGPGPRRLPQDRAPRLAERGRGLERRLGESGDGLQSRRLRLVRAGPGARVHHGYLIEKALSVDNIFVFLVLFSFFKVPEIYQHRVLFWGVLGALVMRAIFIFAGGAFLAKFHWAIYVFGGILAITGLKLLRAGDEQVDPEKNFAVRFLRKFLPVTDGFRGDKFFVRENGARMATPLFVCLGAVEATDVVFAVDSIPAIFAVTQDPFIVFTSNIFAILGLRSLFFLLAGVMDRFVYLKTGLAFILLFVGGKMLVMDWYKVPVLASLGIVFGILAVAVVASLVATRVRPEAVPPVPPVPPAPPAAEV
jgi:tellurite resistance protein TerC